MVVEAKYRNFEVELDWLGHNPEKGTVTLTWKKDEKIFHKTEYNRQDPKEEEKEFYKGINRLRKRPETYQSETWHQEIGCFLTEKFFPEGSKLGKKFREVLRESSRVRLRLFYPNKPAGDTTVTLAKIRALLDIPWEYLYLPPDPGLKLNGYLCSQSRFSLVHCLPKVINPGSPGLEHALPVNVAFLSIENDHLQFPGVFSNIQEDLNQTNHPYIIWMEQIAEAEEHHLTRALQDFDLVQILSHGEDRSLFLKDDDAILGPELKDTLQGINSNLKAVVLCACGVGLKPIGVAAALHCSGIPVVIGMARNITVETAHRFMEQFYYQLGVRACSLEEALAVARNELRERYPSNEGMLRLDWGVPRLFLGAKSSGVMIRKVHLYQPKNDLIKKFDGYINQRVGIAGLQHVEDALQDWINSNKMGVLYLHGPSFAYKSVEIARLLRKNPDLIRHICSDEGLTNHPLVFSRDSLFPQLAKYYGEENFQNWLSEGVYPATAFSSVKAFRDLVITPLQKAVMEKPDKRPVIVIDGLDNAVAAFSTGSILDLLIEHKDWITEGARLIVTADSDAPHSPHQRIMDQLKTEDFSIPGTTPKKEQEHLLMARAGELKLETRLGKSPDLNKWWDNVLSKKEPTQLLVQQQSLQFINQVGEKYAHIFKVEGNPDDYYRAYLDELKIATDGSTILKILAVANEPLSVDMMLSLSELNRTTQIETINSGLRPFVDRLPDETGWKGWTCYHSRIRGLLVEKFHKELDEAHGLFVEMYRPYGQQTWDRVSIWSNLPDTNYARSYLAHHTYERYRNTKDREKRKKRADDFLTLVTSPAFRIFRSAEGVGMAVEDIKRALAVTFVEYGLPAGSQSARALAATERLLAANTDDFAIVNFEQSLQRRNDGINALRDFLGM